MHLPELGCSTLFYPNVADGQHPKSLKGATEDAGMWPQSLLAREHAIPSEKRVQSRGRRRSVVAAQSESDSALTQLRQELEGLGEEGDGEEGLWVDEEEDGASRLLKLDQGEKVEEVRN